MSKDLKKFPQQAQARKASKSGVAGDGAGSVAGSMTRSIAGLVAGSVAGLRESKPYSEDIAGRIYSKNVKKSLYAAVFSVGLFMALTPYVVGQENAASEIKPPEDTNLEITTPKNDVSDAVSVDAVSENAGSENTLSINTVLVNTAQEDTLAENTAQEDTAEERSPPLEDSTPVGIAKNAYDAIENHPSVSALRSQVCQARGQIDQAIAVSLPQVTASLTGASSLSSSIKTREANSRRLDHRDVDAVLTIRQTIFDWGVNRATIKIAENTRYSAMIGVVLEQDRVAGDMLGLASNLEELEKQYQLHADHYEEVSVLADQLEASVEAGVGRINDLRVIKVMQLDIEIAQNRLQREIELLEQELLERFRMVPQQLRPFLAEYRANKPDEVPITNNAVLREVRRLDYQLESSGLELDRLKAERRPALSATIETTLFNIDSYSREYEVEGRMQFSLPLYDGGSNKARQEETQWRRRGISDERDNLLRNHDAQINQIFNRTKQLDDQINKNSAKIAELEQQIAAAQARAGVVENNPLELARLLGQHHGLVSDHQRLLKDRDVNQLQGFFFSDVLGQILNLNQESLSC